MIQHINKLFLVIIALSVLTYFERPDYNLPLFFFVLALWDNIHIPQKQKLWYLITFSILIDFIWIIYWAALWGGYQNREKGLGNFTIFLSVLILIVKFAVVILAFLKDPDCKKALS
jgi:hypothetical protein